MKNKIYFFIPILISLYVNLLSQSSPIANFTTYDSYGEGIENFSTIDAIYLIDTSENNPTGWTWTVKKEPDGVPMVYESTPHPYLKIILDETGQYSVSLVVSNEYGTSSIVKENLFQVHQSSVDSINIFTPNCSQVIDTKNIVEYWSPSDREKFNIGIMKNSPWKDSLFFEQSASHEYNCHGYAWYVEEGGSNAWIGYSKAGSEEIFWNDGSYIECDVNDPDALIVSYVDAVDSLGNIIPNGGNHSARVSGSPGFYKSKWGKLPAYKHYFNNCPYYVNNNIVYYKKAPIQGAEFTSDKTTVEGGEEIQFTNLSHPNFTNFTWTFGDSGSSSDENPAYTFYIQGQKTVLLKASTSKGCERTETKINYITVESTVIHADFSSSSQNVSVGEEIEFYDESTGAADWWWSFPNNSVTFLDLTNNESQNPIVKYNAPGLYTVYLNVANTFVNDSETKENYINVEIGSVLNANFTSDFQTIFVDEFVSFNDLTTGYHNFWEWSFFPSTVTYMDGTDNYSQNPIVRFDEAGTYSVTLSVFDDSGGSDTETKSGFINVEEIPAVVAQFSPEYSVIQESAMISFCDESYGSSVISQWNWVFPGGYPATSSDPNVSVSYFTVGAYDVFLTVSDGYESDTKEGQVVVCDPYNLGVEFSVSQTLIAQNLNLDASCIVMGGSGDFSYEWFLCDLNNNSNTNEPYVSQGCYSIGFFDCYVKVKDNGYGGIFESNHIIVEVYYPFLFACSYLDYTILNKGSNITLFDCSYSSNPIDVWYINFGDNSSESRYEPWESLSHTYNEVGIYNLYYKVSVNSPLMMKDMSHHIQVIDCESGMLELCDFSGLNLGWNYPIISKEIIVGGDCQSGEEPIIPNGAKIEFYASDEITFLEGFSVSADNDGYFSAEAECPGSSKKESNLSQDSDTIITNPLNTTNSLSNSIAIYPNPTNSFIYVTGVESAIVELLSLTGQVIQVHTTNNTSKIDVSSLSKGLYILHIYNKTIDVFEKIVVK